MATWKMVGWRQSLGTSGCICPSSEMMKRYERVVNFLQSAEDEFCFFSVFLHGKSKSTTWRVHNIYGEYVFPNRSEGFSFYFGGLGGGPVFAGRCFHVRNRATVRNRSQPSATCCKSAYFWRGCSSGDNVQIVLQAWVILRIILRGRGSI